MGKGCAGAAMARIVHLPGHLRGDAYRWANSAVGTA